VTDEFPEPAATRPLWLVTLADLALLLVGFLVLVQATKLNPHQLANGLRDGFGHDAPAAMPVEAITVEFAPGSAAPQSTIALLAWAREAARDPRMALTVTGQADGSTADIERVTGSADALAADRARAVAAALAPVVPAGRLSLLTNVQPGRHAALVTLAFAGEPAGKPRP
jgi:hypothetical protein